MANAEPKTANELAVDRTEYAVERTVMAANRNLMAWIRTALSMISFGFTIYKFLLTVTPKVDIGQSVKTSGRHLGLTLIALGTASVVLGTIEYYKTLKHLNRLSERDYRPLNYSFIIGVMVALLGLFLFITILTHTEVI
jgi:putative membrane protein